MACSGRLPALLAIVLAAAACHRAASAQPAAAVDASPQASPEAAPPADAASLPPLHTPEALVPLDVPGFRPAHISIPQGATSPRPILVAAHGAWDFPEGLCDNWRWVIHDRGWVICPRGVPRPPPDKTFGYPSGPALAREIEADVRALAARYPGYVDDGPLVFTGFSLGAILGPSILARDPSRFPRAVLIEGGEDRFTKVYAQAFARGGGQRVLYACGLKFRVAAATRAAHLLESSGVPSRVVLGKLPGAGEFIHWYNGPVAEEIQSQLGWLLEGDARWDVPPR
jgi:hypothetical protein